MNQPVLSVQNPTSTFSRANLNGGGASASGNKVNSKKAKHYPGRIETGLKAYCASLLTAGVMMPVIASLVAAGAYLFYTPFDAVKPTILNAGALSALIISSLFTGALWLVVAIPCSFLHTARNANPRNYSLLSSRLHHLQVSLGLGDDVDVTFEEFNAIMKEKGLDKESDRHTRSVMQEAYICCRDVSRKLNAFPSGLIWSDGTGYNIAWALLHHAEETMIEATDIDTVIREAKHDFLAIQGSQIDNKDGLLADVIRAVAVLKLQPKEAEDYLKEHKPGKIPVTWSQLTKLIHHSSASPLADAAAKNGVEDAHARNEAETAARITLREVRSTLNNFRDRRWEGFVRQRSRLLRAIAVTGIATYISICFVLASGPRPDFILAATLFYIVGAIAGLFVRFFHESRGSTPVDDFGLTTIRLLAIPLLSGLAGMWGALLVILLPDMAFQFSNQLSVATLQGNIAKGLNDIHYLLSPQFLLAAAVFGATPNLVIQSLQQRAEAYATELKGSTASETRGSGVKD